MKQIFLSLVALACVCLSTSAYADRTVVLSGGTSMRMVSVATGNRVPVKEVVSDVEARIDAMKDTIAKLVVQLQAIHSESEVTQEDIDAVVNDIRAILLVAQAPDPSLVEKFVSDLQVVLADGIITDHEMMVLKVDLAHLLDSANVSADAVKDLMYDLQILLDASGIDIDALVSYVESYSDEIKAGVEKLKETVDAVKQQGGVSAPVSSLPAAAMLRRMR